MSIAALIIHTGYCDYLKYGLEITAKNNKTYLIGDDSMEHLGNIPNVIFVNIDKYINNENIIYYKSNFINYSNNNIDFEIMCFIRIFITKLFLQEYNLQKIFFLDSDCILLKNINDYPFEKDIAYQITNNTHRYRMCNSIHNALLNIHFCETFEKLYEDIYITKEKFDLIKYKINYHYNPDETSRKGGGICDMTLYYLLQVNKIIDVQNLAEIKDYNTTKITFINAISLPEGTDSANQYLTETNNNIKGRKKNLIKIHSNMDNKGNYIYDLINKQYVDLFAIHFQGIHKQLLNCTFKDLINY